MSLIYVNNIRGRRDLVKKFFTSGIGVRPGLGEEPVRKSGNRGAATFDGAVDRGQAPAPGRGGKMKKAQCIHMILEDTAHSGRPRGSGAGGADGTNGTTSPGFLEIPEGVSYLAVDGDHRPCLSPDPPPEMNGCWMVEQVWRDNANRLFLINVGLGEPFVNGNPAPPVVLLSAGDEILLDRAGGIVCHVTVFNEVTIGPPPEKEIGKACAVCLTDLSRDTRAIACSGCFKAFHLESEEQPEETRLICARPGRPCPVCRTPMNFESGYLYIPEFCRGH